MKDIKNVCFMEPFGVLAVMDSSLDVFLFDIKLSLTIICYAPIAR